MPKVCLEDLESLLRIGTTNIGIDKRIEIGHVIPLKLLVKTRRGAEPFKTHRPRNCLISLTLKGPS
jgi:hypothetical protein